jgi:hypothetical protein
MLSSTSPEQWQGAFELKTKRAERRGERAESREERAVNASTLCECFVDAYWTEVTGSIS